MNERLFKGKYYKEKISSILIPTADECDIDDEVSSETKANSVYDSSKIQQDRNKLVACKGSPRKGFKVEDLPEVESFSVDPEVRFNPFKLQLYKGKSFNADKQPCHYTSKNCSKRNWS